MKVRLLGVHKFESLETRHTCFLVDGVLAVDAGSLTGSLSLKEQSQVQSVLLTHQHLDHIRDLPGLGLAALDEPAHMDVYALPETLDAVHSYLLNWNIYPDLTLPVASLPPKYRFHPVCPGTHLQVLDYQVKPISVPHSVPCVGFIVQSCSGECVAFTGDASGGLFPFLCDELSPQVLFVDVSFPNRLAELAQRTGHLTPSVLRLELLMALSRELPVPRIVAVHLSPQHQWELAEELALLARELDIDLAPGCPGTLEVQAGVRGDLSSPP